MKKTISRAFSLLLVLALLVSVIPTALAANELSLTAGKSTLTKDETTTVSATVAAGVSTALPSEGVTWKWNVNGSAQIVGEATSSSIEIKAGEVTGTDAEEVTVTATASFKANDGNKDIDFTYTGSTTIQVTPVSAPAEKPTLVVTSSTSDVEVEGNVTLTASFVDAEGEAVTVNDPQITWSYTGDVVTLPETKTGTSIIVTAAKFGTATVTATCADAANGSAQTTINVSKKTVTASISDMPIANTLNLAETADLGISLGDVTGIAPATALNQKWSSSDTKVLTVDQTTGLVTAKGTGSATVSVEISLKADAAADYQLAGANSDGKITLTSQSITVKQGGITLNKYADSIKTGSSGSLTFTISTTTDLPDGVSASNVEYTYVKSAKGGNGTDVSVEIENGVVYVTNPRGVGVVTITLQAKDKSTGVIFAEQDITVGVYTEGTEISAKIKPTVSAFDFDQTNVFSAVSIDGFSKNSNQSLQALVTGNTAYVDIEMECNKSVLSLYYNGSSKVITKVSAQYLDNVKATVNTNASGYQTIPYTWYGANGVIVAKGTMYLWVSESTGDIVYNTSYKEKVVFDSSDFKDFWKKKVADKTVSGTLSYVSFPDMSVGSMPKYGKMYRDTACSYTLDKTASYYITSTSTGYRLDNVTYKPDSSITSPVTVQIPFTAYSTGTATTRDSVSGVIVININQESTTITSYGVQFGNGTNSIADYIADTFKTNTGEVLSYVTFPSLSASTGKLLYDFSGVLDSREVLSTYKFYYNGSKTDLDLDDVVFVPRAGLYGEVTLYYKAYNASATKEYSGTIVLNVKQKTKSAEFSDVGTSYSWAADSVDFLSYEGVAQGSNGKYRPTANITRGDFMLMLYRAFLEDEHKNDSITSNFSDVTKGSTTYSKETYQAVGVAKKLGIAQGTNGKFNPKSYITRQEAMTLIYRTLDEVNYDLDYTVSTTTSSFKDYSSVASYAKTAISDLIGHGIVIGNNSKINPTSNITRAEMAVILHRVLTY